MPDAMLFVGAALGVLLGGVIAWVLAMSRARVTAADELSQLQKQVGGAESTIAELRGQLAERETTIQSLRADLEHQRQARAVADTRLSEAARSVEEQRRLLAEAEQRLKDTFKALSSDILKANSETFAKSTEGKVRPLLDALTRYEEHLKVIERAREGAYGRVTEQLSTIEKSHQQLRDQTSNLVAALRAPNVRGRWGELTLKRVVEVAGLVEHCDFFAQPTVEKDDVRRRPDLIVRLPGRRTIVIDAKVPLDAYLDAVDLRDEELQRHHLTRHAQAVRAHMKALSAKAYWNQFDATPEFVVMFVPGEAFFSAALEHDRSLIEDGMQHRVILATPTTLIALLRTVAYGWQQQQLVDNARRIGETARYLYNRVAKFAEHLAGVGDGLRRATHAYNASVASWQHRIVPMKRRITELGIPAPSPDAADPKEVDTTPRALPAQAVEPPPAADTTPPLWNASDKPQTQPSPASQE